MRLSYPRSFLSLLLIGFTIVAVPLVFALFANAVAFEKLAALSEQAVLAAVRVTQASRALAGQVASLEAAARQYAVAGEAPYLEAYRAGRGSFVGTLRSLEEMTLSGEQRAQALAIAQLEEEILGRLEQLAPSPGFSMQLTADFSRLARQTRVLVAQGERVIDEGIEQLRAQAVRSRSGVFWLLVALIPTAILLIACFTFLIARPISQVSAGIRRLGDGEFGRPIEIEGPGDMVRLGEQLDWLRRKLVALEEQKTRFLQHVSHELKTPLTALREGSDLLSSGVVGTLNAEQLEIARILRENSIELRKLIEGLLNYSAVHAQASILDARIVPLRDIVKRVVNDRKLAMVAKGVRVDMNCENVTAYCDEEKVRVMLDNLLSNAVRHSPERGLVCVKLYKDRTNAVFEVADEGPGIPAQEREKVFEAFFRGADAPLAAIKGSGLGLSIVKEYVELHRGRVEILDGPGAHIRITIPRKRDAREVAA